VVHGFELGEADAMIALTDWNATCQPPWSDRELAHKVRDAMNASHDKPRGHLLGGQSRNGETRGRSTSGRAIKAPPSATQAAKKYDLDAHDAAELPPPLPDGTRALLRAAFEPGDGVRIVPARIGEDGREVPDGDGPCLSREEWLRKLDDKAGDPNRLWKNADGGGIYITVNPLKLGGSKDADVTSYRHALVEFDSISTVEQWTLYQASRLPCTAIISSGGKSVHAWVKVGAKDRSEYDERVAIIYAHFAAYGLDAKNKNPSRLSRLPNCRRFKARQELLALNTGCESFTEWLAEIQADGAGDTLTVDALAEFDAGADTNCILGKRWLCRGGSLLLVGQSGTGKSSLAVQMAATWALGRNLFGIAPVRPLKSLFIQAENDKGDLAEMMQGVLAGMGLSAFSDDFETLKRNLVFVRDTTHTGFEFTQAARRLIDKHRPDLVFIDPLLSFIGDDIGKQSVCGQFLRNWLNPISDASGCIWVMVHHTNKPPADAKARAWWKSADYAYMGSGSSELTNWARAVLTLGMLDDGEFELKLAKRGGRAGACEPDGTPTTRLFLKHAEKGILWQQVTAPPEPEPGEHAPKQSKVQKLAASNLHEILSTLGDGETASALGRKLEAFSRKIGKTVGVTKCRTDLLDLLVGNGKLSYDESTGLYKAGKNA
jgi:RecA-family ATPase